jgi:hypothetical protein
VALVALGARVNAIDQKGLTPLDRAAGKVQVQRCNSCDHDSRVWHGATENGPRTMDESQTPTPYVYI